MKNSNSNRLRLQKIPLKERYEIIIFLFLCFELILMISKNNLDLWVMTPYLITYKFGLLPRAFIGSVLSVFANKITYNVIYTMAIIVFIILITEVSLLLGEVIRNSGQDIQLSVKILSLLFLASPLSITYCLGGYIARFDMYWIIIVLTSLVFLKKRTLIWLVPIFCAIGIMIHQGFMVTYMPALVIPMLYEIHKNRYSKKNIAIFYLSCLSMILIFLFLQFANKNIPFNNTTDFVRHISQYADFPPEFHMVYSEYFCPFPNWTIHVVLPILSYIAIPVGLILFIFSIPLIIIFAYIWKQSFKSTQNKFLKYIFIMCAAAPSVFIVASIFATDLDRWWAAVINNQFIFIFYFVFSKEKPVIDSLQKVGLYLKEHLLLLSLIVTFTNSLTFSKATSLVLSLAFQDVEKFQKILSYVA